LLPTDHSRQAVNACLGNDQDAATMTSIATIRSSPWHVGLAAETNATVSTTPSFNINRNSINKHGPVPAASSVKAGCTKKGRPLDEEKVPGT
jgi:hypothetical protein